MSERSEQQAIFSWADAMAGQYPELALLYANVNGQYRKGQRPEPGMKAGVPDMTLPVARRGFHGLYIELKVGKNKTTHEQEEWLLALKGQGYLAATCWGYDEAVNCISWYLGIGEP